MIFYIKETVKAAEFSTKSIRDMIYVQPGEYKLIKLEYFFNGETIAFFEGLPGLITGTYYGLTLFGRSIKNES